MEDKSWVGFPNSHLALSLELGKPTEHPQPAWTSPNHTHLANHSEKLYVTSHSTPFEISMLTATSRTYLTRILWVRGPIHSMIFTSPLYSFNLFWKSLLSEFGFVYNNIVIMCSFLDGKAHELILVEDFLSRSLIAHCIIAYIARRLKYCKA